MARSLVLLVTAFLGACAPVSGAPWRWNAALRSFARADRESPPQPGGLLFVGSSSIRRWSNLSEDFPDRAVLNRGVDGAELAEVSLRLQELVLPYRPSVIVLYAGDNDLAHGKAPEAVLDAYRSFVEGVRAALPEASILYLAIKPSLARSRLLKEVAAANRLVAEYSAQDPNLVFVDVFTPMLAEDGRPDPKLFVRDGLHLSPEGYALWLERLRPYL